MQQGLVWKHDTDWAAFSSSTFSACGGVGRRLQLEGSCCTKTALPTTPC
jgi:hypothetical protein